MTRDRLDFPLGLSAAREYTPFGCRIEVPNIPIRPVICYFRPMKRLYAVKKSFIAKSSTGGVREFKAGEDVFCGLEQHGDPLTFAQDNREWFVDRQTFMDSRVLSKGLSAKSF